MTVVLLHARGRTGGRSSCVVPADASNARWTDRWDQPNPRGAPRAGGNAQWSLNSRAPARQPEPARCGVPLKRVKRVQTRSAIQPSQSPPALPLLCRPAGARHRARRNSLWGRERGTARRTCPAMTWVGARGARRHAHGAELRYIALHFIALREPTPPGGGASNSGRLAHIPPGAATRRASSCCVSSPRHIRCHQRSRASPAVPSVCIRPQLRCASFTTNRWRGAAAAASTTDLTDLRLRHQ